MTFRTALPAPLAVLTVLAVGTTPASAASLLSTGLEVPGTTTAVCHESLATGAGFTRRELRMAPASGSVAAVLRAASGDWDVAVFDKRTGRAVAGAAGFGPSEVAGGFVGGGRELIVQACRRRGSTRATLSVRADAVPSAGIEKRPSLVKVFVTDEAVKQRVLSGFDVTEHAGHDYLEVVAYGQQDLERLRALGLRFDVLVADLVKEDSARAAASRRSATPAGRAKLRAAGAVVPSGRTDYRHLADFEADLKKLVAENPGLVKPVVLKNKTVEGRAVNGIEITTNVNVVNDGKPVFLQMGAHHAREWPSAEHAMEWAFELVNGVKSGDPQLTRLAGDVRTIVVPVINADGFNVSREAPVDLLANPAYASLGDLSFGFNETAAYLVDPALNYKRKNCRLVPGVDSIPAGACATPPFRVSGVDPNRNYGALWGGPGASALPSAETFRGTGPFSEPETQNVRALVSERQVTTLVTNHTFSNLILRAPGVRALGMSVDEPAMKDLSDRMATKNGYKSQPSYMLYDTTGGTEDWTYGAAGGYGFTFEIGPDATAEKGGGFHPPFAFTAGQYANGSNNGGGNRAAYRLAMENAADPKHHSTLTGTVPAGVTLRVKKQFVTETSPVEPAQTDPPINGTEPPSPAGDKIRFPDTLQSTLDVAKAGRFSWAMNPSTRPVSDQNTLAGVADKPIRKETFTPTKQTEPNQLPTSDEANTFEDVALTVTEADAAKALRVTLAADFPADDYDITLFFKEGTALKEVGSSGQAPGKDEEILLDDPKVGSYVLRVTNYLAFNPWTVTAVRLGQGADTVRPRKATEAWTLTCEVGTTVLASQKVVVERGQTLPVSQPCGANAAVVVAAAKAAAAGGSSGAPTSANSCASAAGFRSVGLKVLGRRKLQLAFARKVPNAVTIDVFRTSSGTRTLSRRVARLARLSKTATFSPKVLADGVYFARFSVKGPRTRVDRRRLTFAVRNGVITKRPAHYRPDSCGLLASAKLENPVFGGLTRQPLRIAFLTSKKSDVSVQVVKAGKVVKRFTLTGVARLKSRRLSVPAASLKAKGDYTVRITAVSGSTRATAALVSRRL